MRLLLVRVLQELGRHGLGWMPRGHEVVALVAQHADDLGGERLIQRCSTIARSAPYSAVTTFVDVEARLSAQGPDIGEGLLGLHRYSYLSRMSFFTDRHALHLAGDLDRLVHVGGGIDEAAELHHVLVGLDVDLRHLERWAR